MSGPRAALNPSGSAEGEQQRWRGERLGLPEDGPDSVAGFGRRGLALVLDWVPCALLAELFTTNPATSALALFALYTAVSLVVASRTPGHALVGLRVAQVTGRGRIGFGGAVVRTVLLCLAIPPVVYDRDGRGLHDKAVGSIVLRTR